MIFYFIGIFDNWCWSWLEDITTRFQYRYPPSPTIDPNKYWLWAMKTEWKGNLARVPRFTSLRKPNSEFLLRLYLQYFPDNTEIWEASNLKNINISEGLNPNWKRGRDLIAEIEKLKNVLIMDYFTSHKMVTWDYFVNLDDDRQRW